MPRYKATTTYNRIGLGTLCQHNFEHNTKGVDMIFKVGGGFVISAREAHGKFLPYCVQNLKNVKLALSSYCISILVHF